MVETKNVYVDSHKKPDVTLILIRNRSESTKSSHLPSPATGAKSLKRILLRSLQSVTRIRLGDSIPRQRHVIDPRVSYKNFFEFLVRSEPDNFLQVKGPGKPDQARPGHIAA